MLLGYIAIGILIMFGMEVSIHVHRDEIEFNGTKVPKFNLFERAIIILLWPIPLGGIIKNIINIFK
jgi:hypothetical protein|tara:strand:- start:3086 stop:3283 length:198 start_codon:yes stop_codon:yes gene_type:complete